MSDPIGLLLGIGAAPTIAYAIARLVFAYRAAEQRRWLAAQRTHIPPAVTGARAPRRGRVPRPVVSPAAGDPAAAEVPFPGAHSSAAVVENQR